MADFQRFGDFWTNIVNNVRPKISEALKISHENAPPLNCRDELGIPLYQETSRYQIFVEFL